MKKKRQAQTFLEYTLLIGVLTGVIVAMTPLLRRGTQAMVKLVADQLGTQQGAEQLGGTRGHLVESVAKREADRVKRRSDSMGTVVYDITRDDVYMEKETTTNLGFSPGATRN
ncbi:MAG: hypothetical protein KAJ18_06350 [Candidatus Omnitrophica bacterium]|nr:hypothetical protein [Candidatus Omnitrophota bacterium]